MAVPFIITTSILKQQMNKKFLAPFIFSFFLLTENAVAQFDKKFTFNGSLGTFVPLGKSVDEDSIPYVFPNFRNGLQASFGGQYNINSRLSLGLNLTTWFALNYKNPIPTPSGAVSIIAEEQKKYNSSYLSKVGLGFDVRYRFFRMAKFNPYIYGEVNINSYGGEVAPRLQYYEQSTDGVYTDDIISNRYTILRFNSKEISTNYAIGLNNGAGVDIMLNDSFTLFIQTGYNIVFTKGDINLRQNLNYVNLVSGLRFSLFRSKSIL